MRATACMEPSSTEDSQVKGQTARMTVTQTVPFSGFIGKKRAQNILEERGRDQPGLCEDPGL